MFAGLQVGEGGIESHGEFAERLGAGDQVIDQIALHRLGGALQAAERERTLGLAALVLCVCLLGYSGVFGDVCLSQTQGLPHGTEPSASRSGCMRMRCNQGRQSCLQFGE